MTDVEQSPVRNVVVVGGGSAGWITAGLIASEFGGRAGSSVQVTLVESPDVKTIGVGEGTWPTMRSTLQKIGLSESDFLRAASATFKQGTRFVGWTSGTADDVYYHPFSAPAGYTSINLVPHWQAHRDRVSFCDAVSVQGYLCERNLAPKQAVTPDYAHVVNYAYHLDAGKFAQLLQSHGVGKLGIRHVVDHVTGISGNPNEDIRALLTNNHGEIVGDLFVDCTGSRALLLGEHFGVPYVDRSDVLFNDSAIAAQVPYASDAHPIASQTISTAQRAGWIWDIGLTTRRGVGYTYSSAHTTDAESEGTLRDYIERSCGVPADAIDARKIAFQPGHRARFWHRNCVAVGMSSGFIEPLEASALVMVELAGRMLAEEMPVNRAAMDVVAKRYNDRFLYRWARIIDFLKLHYVLSEREDSGFWRDNRQAASIPASLHEMLMLWRHRFPRHGDLAQSEEIFSIASYQYVLYGMGFQTDDELRTPPTRHEQEAQRLFADNVASARRMSASLPGNREVLDALTAQASTDLGTAVG